MIRVVVLGQGLVASHLMVGVERIKKNEIKPYGVPLAKYELPYSISDIKFVKSYEVDPSKIGKTVHDVCEELVGDVLPVPEELREITVGEGIHQGSMKGIIENPVGLEEKHGLQEAIEKLSDEWVKLEPDVIINTITTEEASPFKNPEDLEKAIKNDEERVSASHAYAYAAWRYAIKSGRRVTFVNVIPSPIANDPAIVTLYEKAGLVVLGDDGATGATPLTADLMEHLAERNRHVKFIVQFNIGGNTDFLALTKPERNRMKEFTKSSVVADILGYEPPHYIKPTGYLEPLGDKKFVAMHIEYKTFNELEDSLYINARINDSPALAGLLVDLIRLGKIVLDKNLKGTLYEINAFFMKKPGPLEAKSVSRIEAYHRMLRWLRDLGVLRGG